MEVATSFLLKETVSVVASATDDYSWIRMIGYYQPVGSGPIQRWWSSYLRLQNVGVHFVGHRGPLEQ
jgi:hypothetical protein